MPSNYKLIGTDQSIALYLGGKFDGSINPAAPPAPPGDTKSLVGLAKHIGIKESIEMTDVKGIGQDTKANRYHSEGGSLDLDMFVSTTGFAVPQSALGCYLWVIHTPLSAMAAGYTYVGVVTEWNFDGTEGSEQSLKVTLDLTPDFLPFGN